MTLQLKRRCHWRKILRSCLTRFKKDENIADKQVSDTTSRLGVLSEMKIRIIVFESVLRFNFWSLWVSCFHSFFYNTQNSHLVVHWSDLCATDQCCYSNYKEYEQFKLSWEYDVLVSVRPNWDWEKNLPSQLNRAETERQGCITKQAELSASISELRPSNCNSQLAQLGCRPGLNRDLLQAF